MAGLEKYRKRTRVREKKKAFPFSLSEIEAVSEWQPRQEDFKKRGRVLQGQKVYQCSTVQKHSPKGGLC